MNREEMAAYEKHYETAEPPQWSHIHGYEELKRRKRNKMKTLVLIVIIGVVGYGLITLLGPILK